MSTLKLEKVVSFSSEAQKFPSSNLLRQRTSSDSSRKWLAQSSTEDKAFVVLKLQKPSLITAVDIGNEGCAFIEALVSNDRKEFVPLIPSSSFMSPMESRMNETRNRIRTFTRFDDESTGKQWSYVKLVCSQPYNKNWPFGIAFFELRGSTEDSPEEKTGDDSPCASSSAVSSKNGAREEAEGENGPPKAKRFAPNRGHEAESDEESGRPSSSTRRDDVNDSRSKQRSKRDILEGVVFVLSGFQNPLRKQLRDTALSMGAKYRPDWDPQCTHLISAFSNTPKWSQVAAVGGRIVVKDWLEECEKQRKKLPWKNFKCGKYRAKAQDTADGPGDDRDESEPEEEDVEDDDSEYEPEEEDDFDISTRRKTKKASPPPPAPPSPPPLPADLQLDELKEFFKGKRFHLDSDIEENDERNTLTRYIVAHGGELTSQSKSAHYVISWKKGAHSPLWIVKCHQENCFVQE